MIEYNKLVRDKIPEIIEASGKKAIVELLDEKMYVKKLNEKLVEEVKEFLECEESKKKQYESIEELGDVLEVMLAILKHKGYNLGELIEIMDDKREERGGFEKRILLKGVE